MTPYSIKVICPLKKERMNSTKLATFTNTREDLEVSLQVSFYLKTGHAFNFCTISPS